jgi:glycosyltransferase involved in cell wall biosynthesis
VTTTGSRTGSSVSRARVALLTEGTYPFQTGGVSTWCDQIVRGLPEHDFELVSVVATSGQPAKWVLPDNVVSVQSIPIWGWVPAARGPKRDRLRLFVDAFRPFLLSIIAPDTSGVVFAESLRGLFDYAQENPLTAAVLSDAAGEVLREVWESNREERMSIYEGLKALELIEHLLRPLSAPVVQADMCHATSNGLPSLVALLSKWRHGTPFLMSEHGVYLRERYLAFRDFDVPWTVKYVVLTFYRRLTETAYAHADVIAPVNVFNQRWEVEHGADPDTIVTAMNGVDAAQYPVAPEEPDEPVIVWVGRVDPLKDLETLIAAYRKLARRIPAARLDLYGPVPVGNEKYAQRMHEMVSRLGLTGRVRFLGPISPVSSAYHSARVVVLSSISEGLPYTVIEAMMCGRATVSTDVGGVREVTGDAGLLVPPKDPDALAIALEMVLSDDDLRWALAARAQDRGRLYFRLEQMLATFRDEYTRLIHPEEAQFADWPTEADNTLLTVPEQGGPAALVTAGDL